MKKNKEFRLRILNSSYFNSEASESVLDVNKAFGNLFKIGTLYQHLSRHQQVDKITAPTVIPQLEVVSAVEGKVLSGAEHEVGLDEFIKKGRDALARGDMVINAPNFISAIRTKAEIEARTKDRRLDMIKAFFIGDKNGPDERPGLPEAKS